MDLSHLYSLRNEFIIIGLTGRTGSGCTMISDYLSKDFSNIKEGLRNTHEFEDVVFKQKYSIVKSFLSHEDNWKPFEIIKYKNVLLFYILYKYGGNYRKMTILLTKFYRESKTENNKEIVSKVLAEIQKIDRKHSSLISEIKSLKRFDLIDLKEDLNSLNDLFFGPRFKALSSSIFSLIEEHSYYRRTYLLHHVACNIRSSGDPINDLDINIDNIYSIALLLNKLIKARKNHNSSHDKPTRIVIDSLRNSLEIMFFKERYSAFYMLATKDVLNNARERVDFRLKKKVKDSIDRNDLIDKLFKLDDIEYKTNDFSEGNFSSPDVENCIQKSDYHIFNLRKNQLDNYQQSTAIDANEFLTREEQLIKFVALILQPGLITPSSIERSMQMANSAKLNSGCISRKVGAVITDENFYVMAMGWNDVAKGHTPCNLRSVEDYLGGSATLTDNVHYSDFEKGIVSSLSNYKYKNKKPGNFKEAIVDYFEENLEKNRNDLKGKNCSFCFKTIHNYYEGEANQVHTRSLHAEENAMLQITKNGGQGVFSGNLFTTASPCELCSKKAYQLGIKKIYFIDPYPGISNDQILSAGAVNTRPKMIPFSGAIGLVYHKLYEPFMSYKDEISMTLVIKPKNKLGIQFKTVLEKIDNPEIKKYLDKNPNLTEEHVKELIIKGLT